MESVLLIHILFYAVALGSSFTDELCKNIHDCTTDCPDHQCSYQRTYMNGICTASTKQCICTAGIYGPYCNKRCVPGKYGIQCKKFCSECKKDACNRISGCPQNRINNPTTRTTSTKPAGWTQFMLDITTRGGNDDNKTEILIIKDRTAVPWVTILVIIAVIVLFVTASILCMFCRKRCRLRKMKRPVDVNIGKNETADIEKLHEYTYIDINLDIKNQTNIQPLDVNLYMEIPDNYFRKESNRVLKESDQFSVVTSDVNLSTSYTTPLDVVKSSAKHVPHFTETSQRSKDEMGCNSGTPEGVYNILRIIPDSSNGFIHNTYDHMTPSHNLYNDMNFTCQ